jgi:hypothetical protein
MGTILDFPASRWAGSAAECAPREGMGTVLILPVIRIDRSNEERSGSGPKEGTAPGRRRRR